MKPKAETPTHQVAISTGVQFVGKILVMLLGLAAIGLITRYLGVTGFGQYTTVFAYVSFLSVFADFGFFAVLVTQLAKGRDDPSKIVSNIMTLRAVAAVAVYLIGFAIGFLLPYPDAVKLGIGIIAAAWFGQSVNQTLVGVFQVKQAMARPVVADILGRVAVLGLVFAAVSNGWSFQGILMAYLVGAFVTLALNFYFVRVFVAVSLAADLVYWRKVIDLALPMAAVLVLGFIYFKADTVILSLLKGPDDVGIYGVPYKLVEVLLVFPSIFMGTVLPFITLYLATHNATKMANAFGRAFHFLSLIGLPALLVGSLLAKQLVALLGGQEFVSAATVFLKGQAVAGPLVLQVLLFAVFLSYLSHLTTYVVVAAGRQSSLVLPNLIFAFGNIGLNFLLIPYYSYLAAAVITVLTELAVLAVSWRIIWLKIGRFVPDGRYLLKLLLANLILSAAIFPLREVGLLFVLVFAAILYGFLALLLRLVTRQDLAEVLQFRGGASATPA